MNKERGLVSDCSIDRWPMILGNLFTLFVILTPEGVYRLIKQYLLEKKSYPGPKGNFR